MPQRLLTLIVRLSRRRNKEGTKAGEALKPPLHRFCAHTIVLKLTLTDVLWPPFQVFLESTR